MGSNTKGIKKFNMKYTSILIDKIKEGINLSSGFTVGEKDMIHHVLNREDTSHKNMSKEIIDIIRFPFFNVEIIEEIINDHVKTSN